MAGTDLNTWVGPAACLHHQRTPYHGIHRHHHRRMISHYAHSPFDRSHDAAWTCIGVGTGKEGMRGRKKMSLRQSSILHRLLNFSRQCPGNGFGDKSLNIIRKSWQSNIPSVQTCGCGGKGRLRRSTRRMSRRTRAIHRTHKWDEYKLRNRWQL